MITSQFTRPLRIEGHAHELRAGDLVNVSDRPYLIEWARVAEFVPQHGPEFDASGWCDGDCAGVIVFEADEPWHLTEDAKVTARIQVEAA